MYYNKSYTAINRFHNTPLPPEHTFPSFLTLCEAILKSSFLGSFMKHGCCFRREDFLPALLQRMARTMRQVCSKGRMYSEEIDGNVFLTLIHCFKTSKSHHIFWSCYISPGSSPRVNLLDQGRNKHVIFKAAFKSTPPHLVINEHFVSRDGWVDSGQSLCGKLWRQRVDWDLLYVPRAY